MTRDLKENKGLASRSQPCADAGTLPALAREVVKPAAWEGGKCRVPMWSMGCPAGFCDEPANGPQYPLQYLTQMRGWSDRPYCFGPCCPKHGGPGAGEPIIFQDGLTREGRQMWCAVLPGFVNLQESPAGFDANPLMAVANLVRDQSALQNPATTAGSAEGVASGQLREEPK